MQSTFDERNWLAWLVKVRILILTCLLAIQLIVARLTPSALPLRLFVGTNSGPHHIAAAMGTPTVGVHSGVVSAREWGPLGPLAVAVQREMTCGPCYIDKPAHCPRGIACLQGLRPGAVFRVCEQMLGADLRRERLRV